MKLTGKMLLTVVVPLSVALFVEFSAIKTISKSIILDDVISYTEHETDTLISELEKNAEFIDKRSKVTVQRAVILYCFNTQRDHASSGCDYVLLDKEEQLYNNTPVPDDEIRKLAGSSNDERQKGYYYHNEGMEKISYCIVGGNVNLADHEYIVAVVRDISSQLDSMQAMTYPFVLVSVIVTTVLMLITVFMIRNQLKPLKRLQNATQRISNGRFDDRIYVTSNDEVGELANSFNKMSDALSYYIGEMQNAAEEQNIFLHSITHELRTPVTAITGYAYALQSAKLSEEQRDEALAFVYSESFRLQNIVDRLSKLMRIEDGKIDFYQFSTDEMEQTLDALLTPEAKEHNIIFSLNVEHGYKIYGDKDLLVMLVTNLVNNAYKADATEISVTVNHEMISVTDNGCGIDPDKIDKLTQPFYQVDDSRNHEGFGLGLTFCQRIAQVHHSSIEIKSQPGEGSTFSMKLKNIKK